MGRGQIPPTATPSTHLHPPGKGVTPPPRPASLPPSPGPKVAGAAAAAGCPLAVVAAEARAVAAAMGTLGVALSVCTLPGQPTPARLGARPLPCPPPGGRGSVPLVGLGWPGERRLAVGRFSCRVGCILVVV